MACINKFRELSKESQNDFIIKLEKSIPDEVLKKINDVFIVKSAEELEINPYFAEINQYRNMIEMLRKEPHCISYAMEDGKKSDNMLARNIIKFEKMFSCIREDAGSYTCGNYDSNVTLNTIDLKLTFSYIEWYVWLLLLIKNTYC